MSPRMDDGTMFATLVPPELSLDAGAGTFRARILAGGDAGEFPAELEGRFAIDAERINTAVVLRGS